MTLRPQLLMRDEQILLLALALSHCHDRILPNPGSRVDLDQVFRSAEAATYTTGCQASPGAVLLPADFGAQQQAAA
jgi:hypothetical protein